MSTRTDVYYVCNQCLPAEVRGERITVGGLDFDVCGKHRKQAEGFAAYAEKFGTPSALNGASKPLGKGYGSLVGVERVSCGKCPSVVAVNSRYSHAKNVHNVSTGDIEWTPVA